MEAKKLQQAAGLCGLLLLLLSGGCSQVPGKPVYKVYTVEIKGMQFQPAQLTVQRGDTVLFINRDIVAHTATEEGGKAWSSPSLANGNSWSLVVQQNANYYCTFHPVMKGKLLVR
ncbi:MAG: cupredoxin family copper-binding protein [Flavisolibacter sp.]|nr:cupredoxin family copper-binding protein [Flavisolibacter sp.]